MSVYVIASLTIKDAVGSRITDGCCCQQWRNMAPDWLRAAAPLFSRESGRAKDSSSPSFLEIQRNTEAFRFQARRPV